MKYIDTYQVFESKSNLSFTKQPRKKDAKTDVYNVSKSGTLIGQVKWSSRFRGYLFTPTADCESEIKDFVKDIMSEYRAAKKKSKD